jgi:murein tripeptide amidase MpaA
MTDYPAVLTAIRPGAEWSLNGDGFDLTWLSEGEPPTQAECDEAWPTVQFDREYAQVERARHAAYITDADPLFFKWQRGTGTEQAWLDAVQAVKDAHPYPDQP